jgi:type IV pilus assembly protein PilF
MTKFGLQSAVVLLAALLVGGCITETTGGLPPPAPTEERVEAQLDLARGYIEQRDFVRAQGPLQKALEIDPRDVEAHVLSAVLFHAQNEYELAEYHYQYALRIEPNNAQALNNYGTFLYDRGRFEDAIVQLSELVKDTGYRARSQAFENLGLAQLRAGDLTAAEASFQRSLELNFRQAGATLELADIAYQRGDLQQASSRLLEYKTMARRNARSLCLGVKVAAAMGDKDQLASDTMALKNLFPAAAEQCLTNE